MWPFNRNKEDKPAVPAELSNYYQAEKQQQNARLWALGFLTLLATIAIVYGLFLGGRWIVGTFQDDDTSNEPSVTQQDSGTAEGNSNNPMSSDFNEDQAGENGSEGNAPGATDDEQEAGEEVGKTSSATTNLPNTGPAETLAVFMVVTLFAAVAHRLTASRV